MRAGTIGRVAAALILGSLSTGAEAQTASRGQATSPGQARVDNRLPLPPSGGVPTGQPALGPETDAQRQADDQAKKSTTICKGC